MSVLSITIIGVLGTALSVLGTALFAMFWRQFGVLEKGLQRLHDEMHAGFAAAKADRDAGFAAAKAERDAGFAAAKADRDAGFAAAKAERDAGFKRVDEDLKVLESKFDSKHEGIQVVLREHGERLARIETKLGIPPAEAA